jgi:hypothetical protein
MLPKYHIIIGGLVSFALYYIIPLTLTQTIIIFLSSFLIDIDHYIIYGIIHKDWSLKNAKKHFFNFREEWIKTSVEERRKYKRHIFIFHGIEFWLVLFVISEYLPLIIFVLYGFVIHIFLDYIDCIYFKEPLYGKFSQLYVYKTNKKKINFNYVKNQ